MMSLGINYSLFSLLILLRSQIILGISVAVTSDKTVCVDNNITVTCSIDPFTTPPSATWNRNGTVLTTCTSGGICTTDSMEISGIKYSFFGISNGIQVSLQVQPGENDIQWTCNHNSITYPYTFRVLNECSVDNECGWCAFHCDKDIGCIVCIVLGGYVGILIIIITVLVLCGWDLVDACVLVCCILCCIICFCKQDRERDPESNIADGLHYQCCIRGEQFSKQKLTCLTFDGKVANTPTNDNGQQPHTGRNMEEKRPLPAIGERH